MKIKDLYKKYYDISPKDLEYLLRYKYKVDLMSIILGEDIFVDNELFEEDITRIRSDEPLQYIVGFQDFMGLEFKVGKGVLVPRPETEILVSKVSEESVKGKRILDLCCGSGAIGISIAKLYRGKVTLSDISKKALEYSRINAELNEVDVDIINSDIFASINGKFDIIVSNPPYIETEEIKKLESKVKDYEPKIALDGGHDGLNFYKKIIEQADKYMNDNAKLYFEIGHNQGNHLRELLEEKFCDIEVIKDYNDFDRVVKATLRRKNV